MTVSSTDSKVIYGGNGSTTAFAIPFMFLQAEDIEVTLFGTNDVGHTQVLGTDYLLSGISEQTGGVCTMTTAPETGQTVVVRRSPSITQEVDYVENDAFPAASHEAALDKLTMVCQDLSERLGRTITFRVSSAVTGVELPDPQADLVLAWNEAGDDLMNKDVATLGAITLPVSVNQGGTGADNVTEALHNLGFGAAGAAVVCCDDGDEIADVIDKDLLKADTPDLLQAVYGDEAQEISGPDTSGIPITRNHVIYPLSEIGSGLSNATQFPYDGTYVFHIYPNGKSLLLGSEFKLPVNGVEPDSSAGEIRIVVEVFNGRKSIVSVQNLEV